MKGMKFSIIIGFLAVLIFCGMYFTVIKEKSEKIAVKEKEYEELETKLSKTIAVVKRKQEAARKLKIVSAKWNQAKKMLPTEASISTLLTTLTKQSSKNEVKIKHLKPLGRSSKDKYDEIRIEMQVQGSYHKIGSFMADLNNMERIVNVRNLKLNPVSAGEDEEPQISASFNLLTYVTKGGKVEG
ncbi:type 4a pilus biogenesis protein PilO [candidate division WOR-3 bacterium]|nr:type 4a pilus biogenesis protein PilO [candidate division WOR-3 bacterium]